jgi:hypothetical protein
MSEVICTDVRSLVHGAVGATCLHGPVMGDRGGVLAVIARGDFRQSRSCHVNDRSRDSQAALAFPQAGRVTQAVSAPS